MLKCYQAAFQYMGNVTLCLEVTPRHDKKLAMHISGFMHKYSFRQHQQKFMKLNTFVSMCSTFNSSKIILSLSAFTPSFSTSQYMVDPFSPYTQLTPLKAFHHTVS